VIFTLLVLYQIKHFICDYPLQGSWMLGKFKKFPDFVMPLFAHSLVHGLATYMIVLAYRPSLALWLGFFDIGMHFLIDRIKASPSLLGRFKPLTPSGYLMAKRMSDGMSIASGEPMPSDRVDEKTLEAYKEMGTKDLRSNTFFWWALGADQMAHHLTHYAIIWAILS